MKSESGETTMAVVKVEEVSVESLFANLTHVDVQYALWCIESGDPELIKEGKRQFALGKNNARLLIAFLKATRSVISAQDRNLANSVRRAALLASGPAGQKTAKAYWDMQFLFSELLLPTQPFVARMAFKVL
jgi:hypothetical protein